jgi:S-adenosylmethionine-diacylglycerol 3-amino-3-carboxypropyl transferase
MFEDLTFQAAFRRLFVYNILFEDTEVDGRYFRVDEKSRVLGISAAGCGLASLLRFHPERVDAVDINRHHLALAGLRISAAQNLTDYGTFYRLFGEGKVESPERVVGPLADRLPDWIKAYWSKHYGRFQKGIYDCGLTALMLRWLRQHVGVGSEWMVEFVHKSESERVAAVYKLFEPAFRKPLVRYLLNSPLQQLALGVNFTQRSKLEDGGKDELSQFFLEHCQRVAKTDCKTNWFAWYAIAGHYNHSDPEAVPPYLRESAHQRSIQAPTVTNYHHRSILDVLSEGKMNKWTHYSLCDAVDWMQEPVQRNLFSEIKRTAEPGAMVLMRSVSNRNVIEHLGLTKNFIHLPDVSKRATSEERSRQYQRVDFFQVSP